MADIKISIPQENITKAQEIQLIAGFYAALPQDSYLKTILKGFPEYCTSEIENDFGINPLETVAHYREKADTAENERQAMKLIRDRDVEEANRQRDNFKQAAR